MTRKQFYSFIKLQHYYMCALQEKYTTKRTSLISRCEDRIAHEYKFNSVPNAKM